MSKKKKCLIITGISVGTLLTAVAGFAIYVYSLAKSLSKLKIYEDDEDFDFE